MYDTEYVFYSNKKDDELLILKLSYLSEKYPTRGLIHIMEYTTGRSGIEP